MKIVNLLYTKFRKVFLHYHPNLYTTCDKYKSVIKFIIAGSLATFVDLFFLTLFYSCFSYNLVLSTSLAFILSFILSFNVQKFWTFRNSYNKKVSRQLIFYILNALFGLSLNGYLMHLLVNIWGTWYILAQATVSLFIGIYNFFIYRFLIFRPQKI